MSDTLSQLADIARGSPRLAVLGALWLTGAKDAVNRAIDIEEALAYAEAVGIEVDLEAAVAGVRTSWEPKMTVARVLLDQIEYQLGVGQSNE